MSDTKTETKAIQRTTHDAVSDLLRAQKAAIAQLVPAHMTPERLMRVALNCIAKSPQLQACSPSSLMQCMLAAFELGLEPGGALGHFYIIPFKGVATPIIGYRGFVALALRSGLVSTVRAVVVHQRDSFRPIEGYEPSIHHEPYIGGDAGPLTHVYSVVRMRDGSTQAEWMTRAQVDSIRARSRSSGDGPWVTDYDEQAKKTVFRRLAKWLPLSSELFEKALEIDNEDYVDGEVSAPVPDVALKERVAAKRSMKMVDVPPPEIPADANEVLS